MVLNKKFTLIILAILALIGSFVTFYTTNLVMHDVANNFFGVQDAGCIISFAGFVFSWDFVLATLFIIRIFRRPEYKKAIVKLYSTILLVFSALGLVASILTGAVMYGTFLSPNPFPGYAIICTIFNALLLACSILVKILVLPKMPEDLEKRKMKTSYVLYSILLSFMTWFAYNRLGALLWAPSYVQIRTLDLTWIFYLYLCLPILWVIHVVLRMFDKEKKQINGQFVFSLVILGLNLVLGFAVFIVGATHTEFISAISPALGLERLASLPIDSIIQFGFGVGLSIYEAIYAFKMVLKHTKE